MNIEKLKQRMALDMELIAWMAMHGACVLVLKHPQLGSGPGREMLEGVKMTLANMLVEAEVFTPEEMAGIERGEPPPGLDG